MGNEQGRVLSPEEALNKRHLGLIQDSELKRRLAKGIDYNSTLVSDSSRTKFLGEIQYKFQLLFTFSKNVF
jgi:cobyrinic acid a,c-diamide synthase